MLKYIFVVLTICSSAVAQILLKKASNYTIKEVSFFVFMGIAGIVFVLSFFLTTLCYKNFPISKIFPVFSLGAIIMIPLSGVIFLGEAIAVKQIIGIICAAAVIVFMLR
ncbi:SMR family transporter [Breznakiellaceae bacterium SP9]